MSQATFGRVHTWALDETIKSADLNAEFNNILNNLNPPGVGSYSDTAATMRLTTDPGATGSESLATSLAGEIERLRFTIKRIIGNAATNWYDSPTTDLTTLLTSIGPTLYANRIISGPTTGNSSQLLALVPSGSTASVVLTASSTTPFVYAVSGTNYTISANQTISGLSLAAVNQTAHIAPGGAVGASQQWTKALGQYGTKLVMGLPATGITNLAGSYAAFQNNTEYLLAYVASSTALSCAWRGSLFNSTKVLAAAQPLTAAATIFNLLKLTWIFANTSGSLAVTYTNPTVSGTQPSSPSTGDYWLDISTTAWKTYNSTTWVKANATLIGICAQDTAACVAARTFDSYISPNGDNTALLDYISSTTVQDRGPFSNVNVFGTRVNFGPTKPSWTTSTLDTGVTLSASSVYGLYLKENGTPIVSDVFPLHRRDLMGYYHPAETWRCIGTVRTDVNTAFASPVRNFHDAAELAQILDPVAYQYPSIPLEPQAVPALFSDRFVQANSTALSTWAVTQAQYGDLATISLTPGVWSLNAQATLQVTSGTAASSVWSIGIGQASGNSFSDASDGFNQSNGLIPGAIVITVNTTAYTAAINYANTLTIPGMLTTVNTAAQSYYLKMIINTTAAATYQVNGWRITASRIDDLIGGQA